ncbi:Signal transduction histidine kinase [Clostridium cavendishii DSM 21758]|uniref:histidine kinase n=1 Tax=Clostridium cavendishii DSM 21758 TaxID=1121302 RepID=A0A1M6D9Z3_9CLOT|nr:sensor histidine kinase [Clostridium cavendishii]SHI70056.1 Signal transduction histidine kinase [Clostridium cavendishii DSM 21758]
MKKINKISAMFFTIIVFTNIFLNNIIAYGNEKEYKFKRMTIEDGLAQSSAQVIFQDSKGYMWFGTSDGLNRYDGYNFVSYKYKLNDENSLVSNYVDGIAEDKDGSLWVATSKGLNRLDPNTNKITRYTSDSTSETNKLSNYNVWSVVVDKNGFKWAGTTDGLNKIDNSTGKIVKFFNDEKDENSLSNNFITCLYAEDDLLWVGTKNGINIYDEKINKFTRYEHFDNDINSISDKFIRKIYKDRKGDIWIATENGLDKYNRQNNNFTRYKILNTEDFVLSNRIMDMLEDSNGEFWVATADGIAKLDRDTGKFTRYKNNYYDTQSLISNNVLTLFEDKSGMIWVGTYKGISLFNPNAKFQNYKKDPVNPNSINAESLNGILEDDEGLIWIGTDEGGVNVLNRETKEVKHYMYEKGNNNSLSDNHVYTILQDNDGEIWIATYDGLNKYNKTKKEFTRYKHDKLDKNSLTTNEIRFLYQDKDGILWVGTRDGLNSFDKRTNKFTRYKEFFNEKGIEDNFISAIYEDSNGTLWIGCSIEGGLVRFDKKTKETKIYRYNASDENTISFNSIRSIAEDSKGNLWIATNYGLNKLDTKEEKFTRYIEKDGLINNYVYGVLIDKEDNPWASTNGGLSKLNVSKNCFTNYTITDGLQSNEFNAYSCFKSKTGEMFFGGINGLNSFMPQNIKEKQYTPDIIIENFKVLDKPKILNDDINLKYDENFFSLEFFMPDFRSPNKIEYEYKLEGADKDWIYSKGRNFANYTNIKDGNYVFKVKARNSNGIWSKEKSVRINIATAPWKSKWAYCFYGLTVIFIIYLVWNYVKILETLVRQRTNQLNNKLAENKKLYKRLIKNEKFKNDYFVNLSHELRTPLNVILSTVQLIDKLNDEKFKLNKDNINKYMKIIKRNSDNLLKIINDLIDTSKIEAGSYKIETKSIDIVYLLEETALSMKEFIESNGLELIIDPEVEERYIECAEDDIQRCIINLLSNAVKFTPEGGVIYVSLYDKENFIEISIKDTGIGIKEEDRELIFNRFGQASNEVICKKNIKSSGIGLTLVKYLVEMHGGSISVESEINKGSEFIIKLPANI